MRIDWIRTPYATDFDMFQFCAEHLILLLLPTAVDAARLHAVRLMEMGTDCYAVRQ